MVQLPIDGKLDNKILPVRMVEQVGCVAVATGADGGGAIFTITAICVLGPSHTGKPLEFV